jgi:hypothetical protein
LGPVNRLACLSDVMFFRNGNGLQHMDVLHAVRRIHCDEVPQSAVRGQYGSGHLAAKKRPATARKPAWRPDGLYRAVHLPVSARRGQSHGWHVKNALAHLLFYNLTGSAAYSTVYILIGYFFGKQWKLLAAWLGPRRFA